MVGARLEHAVDRFLQVARRHDAGRVDRRARFRRCARTAGGARMIQIVLIAGVADNGVIGQGGTMPWRLKSDMRHFRALTLGKPVVMGRKTWLSTSIKPLPGRTNIVVTRDGVHRAGRAGRAEPRCRIRSRARRRDAAGRERHHGDRRRGNLRAGDAVRGSAGDHADPPQPEGDTRFPRSTRRSGARRRARPTRQARGTMRDTIS